MSKYPPPLIHDDGSLLCPLDEWLDGIYRTTCRRYLTAQGRCPKHWGYRIPDNQGESMSNPTLSEATKRLAGAVPAKPEWDRGSVAVRTEDLETVTEALSGYVTAAEAQDDTES